MYCHILKDKNTNEEYLIPGCYSVANTFGAGIDFMYNPEIIKSYCTRPRKNKNEEKYEVHTKDEVIILLDNLELKIKQQKEYLAKLEEEFDAIKSEVFMLNTIATQ